MAIGPLIPPILHCIEARSHFARFPLTSSMPERERELSVPIVNVVHRETVRIPGSIDTKWSIS